MLSLIELLKKPSLSRNDFISNLYKNEEDIRLCSDSYVGILLEEDLETVLSKSNIELLISNDELAILAQENLFYTIKYERSTACSESIELYLNFNTLEQITYEKKHRYVKLDNGITYDFVDINDCVKAIMEEYHRCSVSMYDLLACIEIIGLSIEDNINVYAECMRKSDGDAILHIREELDNKFLNQHEILGLKKAAK